MTKKARQKRTPSQKGYAFTEEQFQISVVDVLKKCVKKDVIWTHFPAGGGGRVRGARLKKMGLFPGWPDLMFVHQGRIYFVELKAKHGRLSPNQKEIQNKLVSNHCPVATCKTVDEVLHFLSEHGLLNASKVPSQKE